MAKIISLEDKKLKREGPLPAPKYDPNIPYSWTPEDDFVLDGNEFGLIYQTLKTEASVPGGVSARQKVAAFELLEQILSHAVEVGVAKPLQENKVKEEAPN